MKSIIVFAGTALMFAASLVSAPPVVAHTEVIGYHPARLDSSGHLLPWYAEDPGYAFDHTVNLVWFYWHHIPPYWDQPVGKPALGAIDLPKYMLFRTLETVGIGGDQFAMMLSSWALYYQYSGDPEVPKNMRYQADTYLDHGLSPASASWPNLPFPGNTQHKLLYDGDVVLGPGVTQPDKAGSLGAELVTLYKITGNRRYLDSAVDIANVLARKTQAGDETHSPLPFKVVAATGEIKSAYTTNWTGTLRLFQSMNELKTGDTRAYSKSFDILLSWLKRYPIHNNRWGPFFEDIPGWSDTEINAGTLAWYLMENKSWDPDWKTDVRRMQDWVIATLGNHSLDHLGVTIINEQTAYKVPGQSHTSRHASVELRYAADSGDTANKQMAIRQLNWSTYAVDDDGKNKYPDPRTYEIWWTDGYGDFVRHYLRAMADAPELAPRDGNHLLRSSSVVQDIQYEPKSIHYKKFDARSIDLLKIGVGRPVSIDGGSMKWNPANQVLQIQSTSPSVKITLQ